MGNQNIVRRLEELTDKQVAASVFYQVLDGGSYSTGQHFEDVSAGNTKQLYIENNNADVSLVVFNPTVRTGGSTIVGKAFNPTVGTAGDAPATGIINKASDGAGPTGVSAAIGGDDETGAYSGGEQFSDKQVGGGTNAASVSPGASGGVDVANIVAPGDSLLISAQNDAGTAINISIDADWFEIDDSSLDTDV